MAQAHSVISTFIPPCTVPSSYTPPPRHSSIRIVLSGSNPGFLRRDPATNQDEWIFQTTICRSKARVVCLGGEDQAREAARKALESALGGKKDVFNKWDEEIKKRESGGGVGGPGGRGGQGGDLQDGDSWEEAKQMFLAFAGLVTVYLLITQGKSILAVTVNGMLFVLRGFKRPSNSLPSSSSKGPVPRRGSETAEAHVINKWGRD